MPRRVSNTLLQPTERKADQKFGTNKQTPSTGTASTKGVACEGWSSRSTSYSPADEGEELGHPVAVGRLAGARRPDHHLPEHHPPPG